ncbi:MAG: RICIN domain-containing protein [Bacteroidales bacterium]|nr:RICIN domain-containing protein [Bacteroidales bacterium]
MKQFLCSLLILLCTLQVYSQRKMEKLERGLVAVRKSATQVFLSWRVYGTEFNENVSFNLYRDDVLISSGLNVSNYTDTISTNGNYQVAAVVDDIEQKKSAASPVNTYLHGSNTLACIKIPINNLPGYNTQAIWTGDLDGDGEYDFVLCKINWAENTPIILEAYTRKGDFLWKYNCGPNSYNKDNISPGSSAFCMGHGDNLTVHDINNDGFAEVIVRSANGVIFGDGKILESNFGNSKQFITILEGTTGKEIARAEVPEDFINIGPMNGHMGIAYLDGVNPSVVWSSKNRRADKGFNMLVSTYNWQNDSLVLNWKFNRETSGINMADGHNIRIIDVDGDGKDEITPFGYCLDDDGSLLYSLAGQYVEHGDRFFIGDMDPSREGLEGYGIQQGYSAIGIIWYYYDAKTGQIIHQQLEDPIVGNDYARGYVGDMDPRYPYFEFFTFTDGLYNVNGTRITTSKPDSYPNLRIWWDGDLLSENLDNLKMTKWDYIADIDNSEIRLYTFRNVLQDPRKTPAFYGDILGDWREEAVYAADDGNSILIFTTVESTNTRLYTLPHNPGYRNCFNVRGYYQGHMADFYIGHGMEAPQKPSIQILNQDKGRRLPGGLHFIRAVHSGLYLDTTDHVSQQQKLDNAGQVWEIHYQDSLCIIFSPAAGKFLKYLSVDTLSEIFLSDSASLFYLAESGPHRFVISSPFDTTFLVAVQDSSLAEGAKLKWDKKSGQEFEFQITANYLDCHNDWKGTAKYDNCGVCSGGNTGYYACSSLVEGYYKIKSIKSGLCLQQNDSSLVLGTCNNSASQVWNISENEFGSYFIVNQGTEKYLGFDSIAAGYEILVTNTGRALRFEKNTTGDYYIKSQQNPALGLSIAGDNETEGAKLVLDKTSTSDSNLFVLENYVTGINIAENRPDVKIYPNPAVDKIMVELIGREGEVFTFNLYDNLGRRVLSIPISNRGTINIGDLLPGVFHVKIVSDKSLVYSYRIIKM